MERKRQLITSCPVRHWRVFHSAMGRPFIDDIDLPFIAFFPNNATSSFGIESLFDLSVFIRVAHQYNYVTIVNPAWSGDIIVAHHAIGD